MSNKPISNQPTQGPPVELYKGSPLTLTLSLPQGYDPAATAELRRGEVPLPQSMQPVVSGSGQTRTITLTDEQTDALPRNGNLVVLFDGVAKITFPFRVGLDGNFNPSTTALSITLSEGAPVELSFLERGPQGPTGATGPQGTQGPQGEQGPQGAPYTESAEFQTLAAQVSDDAGQTAADRVATGQDRTAVVDLKADVVVLHGEVDADATAVELSRQQVATNTGLASGFKTAAELAKTGAESAAASIVPYKPYGGFNAATLASTDPVAPAGITFPLVAGSSRGAEVGRGFTCIVPGTNSLTGASVAWAVGDEAIWREGAWYRRPASSYSKSESDKLRFGVFHEKATLDSRTVLARVIRSFSLSANDGARKFSVFSYDKNAGGNNLARFYFADTTAIADTVAPATGDLRAYAECSLNLSGIRTIPITERNSSGYTGTMTVDMDAIIADSTYGKGAAATYAETGLAPKPQVQPTAPIPGEVEGLQLAYRVGGVLTIIAPYSDTQKLRIVFKKCLYNQLITWYTIELINSSGALLISDITATRAKLVASQDITDWIGPYQVQYGLFTGASHGWPSTGGFTRPTAANVSYTFRGDGKIIPEGEYLTYTEITVTCRNEVYDYTSVGNNSPIVDLYEDAVYRVCRGQIEIGFSITAARNISVKRYYGLQALNGLPTGTAYNRMYVAHSAINDTNAYNSSNDYGAISAYPSVEKVIMTDSGGVDCLAMWLDASVGLGSTRLTYQPPTTPAIRVTGNKTYFGMVFEGATPLTLNTGQSAFWHGGYTPFRSLAADTRHYAYITREEGKVFLNVDFARNDISGSVSETIQVEETAMRRLEVVRKDSTITVDSLFSAGSGVTIRATGYGNVKLRLV